MADRDVPERLRDRIGQRRDAEAGRPFTPEVITRLVDKGIGVTPLVLHTGVASLETAGREDGVVHPFDGWTDLVVTPERGGVSSMAC